MPKKSAGIVLYRFHNNQTEVLLVHPGGPFWKKRELGAWSVPKGEIDKNEDPLIAAKRETEEETGAKPEGNFIELTPIIQKGGKTVLAWAVEGNFDPAEVKSNFFEMEWPPESGKYQSFPEVDKAGWFAIDEAKIKIIPAQAALLEELENKLSSL